MADDLMWEFTIPRATRRARRSDPVTSHEAATAIAGKLGTVQQWVLRCVKAHPGLTAPELARRCDIGDVRKLNRRLPELERAGLVQREVTLLPCSVSGRKAARWTARGSR